MSPTLILALQSFLIFLQMVNASIAGMAHINPIISVLLSAFVGAFQFFMTHLGNQVQPTPKSVPGSLRDLTTLDLKDPK